MVAPLLTLPYLARVIGFEGLGILATAAATCAWLGILVDWGFNLTGTRAVSTRRIDLEEVSRIFSAVTATKFILILLSSALLAGTALVVPPIKQHGAVYLFSFTFVAAQALLPTWAFQGMERMASIAVINAAGKIISAMLVLLLVKHRHQVVIVPFINTIVSLAVAAVATYQLRTKLGVRYARPTATQIRSVLRDGREIFVATAAGNIYSQGPVLILNLFADIISVGKYSIAQKISVAAVSIFQSVSQAYFPHLSRLWLDAPGRFVSLVQRYVGTTQLASAILLGTLFTFAPDVYLLLTGARDPQGIEAIRYWLVIAQLTVLSVLLNPVLISIGRDRDMARMYIGCSLSFLAYSCVLTWQFRLQGMLTSMIIVEATIALASIASFVRGTKIRAIGDA